MSHLQAKRTQTHEQRRVRHVRHQARRRPAVDRGACALARRRAHQAEARSAAARRFVHLCYSIVITCPYIDIPDSHLTCYMYRNRFDAMAKNVMTVSKNIACASVRMVAVLLARSQTQCFTFIDQHMTYITHSKLL